MLEIQRTGPAGAPVGSAEAIVGLLSLLAGEGPFSNATARECWGRQSGGSRQRTVEMKHSLTQIDWSPLMMKGLGGVKVRADG